MWLVIDTNVLVSALLAGTSLPAHIIELWREGRFDLLISTEQLDELMRVTRHALTLNLDHPSGTGHPHIAVVRRRIH